MLLICSFDVVRHHWSYYYYLHKWFVALVWYVCGCVVVRCECGNTRSLGVHVFAKVHGYVHTVSNYAPVQVYTPYHATFLSSLPSLPSPISLYPPLLSSHFSQCFVPRTPTHTVTCASLSDWTLKWSSMNTTMR